MEENGSNLNDIIGKFNDILKDKNIDLGKVLGDNDPPNEPLNFDFDLDTILKFKNIYQKINDNNNPRNRLLYSLKPFLRDSRKKKLDEYIKIANLLGVLSLLNDMNSNGKGSAWSLNLLNFQDLRDDDIILIIILLLLFTKWKNGGQKGDTYQKAPFCLPFFI